MAKQVQTRVRKKERKNITNGVVHFNSSFNKTIVKINDVEVKTLCW